MVGHALASAMTHDVGQATINILDLDEPRPRDERLNLSSAVMRPRVNDQTLERPKTGKTWAGPGLGKREAARRLARMQKGKDDAS